MGRTEHPSTMEGLAFPHRSSKGANLRRMQSEYQIGSSRTGPPLGPPRSREHAHARQGFWNTVMDRPPPSLASSTSFHGGFPSSLGNTSSSHVVPTQSFHGSTAGPSRQSSGRSSTQKRFQCPDCNVGYSTTHELSAHRQRYHPKQARPFQCDQCTVCFSQKSHLNQHVRTVHEKVRPHKCNECPKAFGKKYDLVSHKHAVHNNDRPHACDICDKRFAKRSNLTRHKEKLHPGRR